MDRGAKSGARSGNPNEPIAIISPGRWPVAAWFGPDKGTDPFIEIRDLTQAGDWVQLFIDQIDVVQKSLAIGLLGAVAVPNYLLPWSSCAARTVPSFDCKLRTSYMKSIASSATDGLVTGHLFQWTLTLQSRLDKGLWA